MGETASVVTAAELRAIIDRLSARALGPGSAVMSSSGSAPRSAFPDGGDRLELIGVLEELRSVVAAAQAAEVARLAAERRVAVEVEIAAVPRPGVGKARRREEARRRIVAEVARARRISPWQATRFVAFAEQARTDLPSTFELLATGRLSEHRARVVFTAVTPLPPEQRAAVDAKLAPELPTLGDGRVDRRARALVYELDPAGAAQRNAYAVGQRRVSVRPAPDCMAWVTTLTTMPLAVAIRAQLERDVRAAVAAGDQRGRGALMADTLVARVLNPAPPAEKPASADTADPTVDDSRTSTSTGWRAPVVPDGAAFTGPVAIQLVINDRTLTGGDAPAHFPNGEPYPAPLARTLALGTDASGRIDTTAARSIRRLFTDPAGRLVTAETASRTFTPAMRNLVKLRDGTCTTPWCDAPITDIDHHDPAARGGPTSTTNARGTCRWCNVTKSDRPPSPSPRAEPHRSAPDRPSPRSGRRSPLERRVRRHLRRAIRQARSTPPNQVRTSPEAVRLRP